MNEERRERWLKLRVGIFVLVALLAFFGMIYALGARARLFEARYTIHTDFTEVGGLAEGATVRLAGVQIGRVSGVHLPLQPGGKVRVDLNITRQYADRIRRNSQARLDTQGLLGDKIIEITVGTADAPVVRPGEAIAAQDPVNIGQVLSEGTQTVKNVATLTETLRQTAEAFNKSRIVEDVAASTGAARRATEELARIVEQAERGRGWVHALLYEEPVALRRLNDLMVKTQALLERVERGEGAVGVLASPKSTEAARKFVAAMERIGQMAERGEGAEGLLPALLFDPKYKAVLDDLPRALGDLRATVASLREITERINEGEGTLGALIADPAIYERLAAILDGAQRSVLLRALIRSLGRDQDKQE
ncbi:MAG: MCE family protein [Candidatus Rokubacteria bacterium]|nr:MCE family protein [Candidatus Rokubacteria bacterium]MBI4594676.1 MCE family protein [Candidatus Rokubacteria bacterium]